MYHISTFEICSMFIMSKFEISRVEIGYVTLITFLTRVYDHSDLCNSGLYNSVKCTGPIFSDFTFTGFTFRSFKEKCKNSEKNSERKFVSAKKKL